MLALVWDAPIARLRPLARQAAVRAYLLVVQVRHQRDPHGASSTTIVAPALAV
jgi:hypothetical protein